MARNLTGACRSYKSKGSSSLRGIEKNISTGKVRGYGTVPQERCLFVRCKPKYRNDGLEKVSMDLDVLA